MYTKDSSIAAFEAMGPIPNANLLVGENGLSCFFLATPMTAEISPFFTSLKALDHGTISYLSL